MLGRDNLTAIAQQALAFSNADQTEALVTSGDKRLTRFAGNHIHQNVSETDARVRVRVVVGKKVGVASGNDLGAASLKKIVESAETVARYQQDNPDFVSLPGPQLIEEMAAYAGATAACTPQDRAMGVGVVCDMARQNGLVASGAFSTAVDEIMVANSRGVSAYHCRTFANLVTVIMGKNSSGYASASSMDVTEIDPAEVGRIAVDKALRSRDPTDLEPGDYTVILEEEAVAGMLFTLAYLGLGALAVQEGRSFMSGRFGAKITGDNITVWDDAYDTRGMAMPFDYEGVPKQKVVLIENGVARNVVYDSFTAGREPGRVSTGHSLPAPNTMGPLPMNLFMASGEASKEEMVASTERGIWVTRFHYTNPVHPVKTVLTGMTRDGTFLIENGKITRPVKNMRFTQSILKALAHATMLGQKTRLIRVGFGGGLGVCAPAAKIDGFTFTGATEF